MNIKILDSWLREFLDTNASAKQIAEKLSLTSVSVDRLDKVGDDFVFDIEVTTNHPEMASVIGIAREAGAVLPQFNIPAKFIPPKLRGPQANAKEKVVLQVKNDNRLVNRVLAVVMEVNLGKSPLIISKRLEATGIRSLNNVVDITNYTMRTIGHPTHVFDYDRLGESITIREAKKGEKITTLDGKRYELPGGDIVAESKNGDVIDLLGVMGLENSVVTENTKRIVYFIDNVNPLKIRSTSMKLGIRTEAAVLNEKTIDPELANTAFLFGIELFEKFADGKVVSNLIDIYPNKPKTKTVIVSEQKIGQVIGVEVSLKKSADILTSLGFEMKIEGDKLTARVPSFRESDIEIKEDLVEEIARVYGYENIPNKLPEINSAQVTNLEKNEFYWEKRLKNALKYWGFTEVYTYSFVSENLFEGPLEDAVTLANPLTEEFVYMRKTLVPSLLQVISENKSFEQIKIFELANIYEKRAHDLPHEIRKLAGVIKQENVDFYKVKGIIEQLLNDLGITSLTWKPTEQGGLGADLYINKEYLGELEVLDDNLINFELDFEVILKHATLKKTIKPLSKFPPIIEDITLIVKDDVSTGDIISEIERQSKIIEEVSLLDKFKDTRTFHIVYRHEDKNLTTEEVAEIRKKVIKALKEKFDAKVK